MKFLKASVFFLFITLYSTTSYAAFHLDVSPRQGGQTIRLEPSGFHEVGEVNLVVTSDQAVQYRIYAFFASPLRNEFGNTISQEGLIVYSRSDAGLLGTSRIERETPVTLGQKQLYVSNAAGDSETIPLVFHLEVPADQPGGIYYGNITFTAEPVNAAAGVSPSVGNLNIQVEIRPTFSMAIKNSNGGTGLNLGVKKDGNVSNEFLKIRTVSNVGSGYKIVQQLSEPLISETGAALDEENILLSVQGGENGNVNLREGTPLSSAPQVLYISDPRGLGDDMDVVYEVKSDSLQKSGTYSGILSFWAESSSHLVVKNIYNVPVRLKIDPIFDLKVESEKGETSFFFKEGQEEKDVTLTVLSNLGTRYQISQRLSGKFTNQHGKEIPQNNFQYSLLPTNSGSVSATAPLPVPEGESVIFVSDGKGTPETIKIHYKLKTEGAWEGSYSANISYSITA